MSFRALSFSCPCSESRLCIPSCISVPSLAVLCLDQACLLLLLLLPDAPVQCVPASSCNVLGVTRDAELPLCTLHVPTSVTVSAGMLIWGKPSSMTTRQSSNVITACSNKFQTRKSERSLCLRSLTQPTGRGRQHNNRRHIQ